MARDVTVPAGASPGPPGRAFGGTHGHDAQRSGAGPPTMAMGPSSPGLFLVCNTVTPPQLCRLETFCCCFGRGSHQTNVEMGGKEGIVPFRHRWQSSVCSILVPVHLGWPLLWSWPGRLEQHPPRALRWVTAAFTKPGEVGDLRQGNWASTETSTAGSCQGSMLMPTQRLTGALTGADSEYAISSYKRRLRHTALP